MDGILVQSGITAKQKEVLIAIDKMDKIGKAGVAEELSKLGFNKPQITKLMNFLSSKYTFASLSKNYCS